MFAVPTKFLRGYALFTTALVGPLAVTVLRQGQDEHAHFTEIDVERINIVEPDGQYRMILSNRARSSGPIYKGQPFGYPGGSRPGILFFNDEGTENGGLTFQGAERADGSYSATGHFSFDQFDQDQVVYLQYADENGKRRMGLTVADRADVDIFDLVKEMEALREMPAGPERDARAKELQAPRDGVPLFAQRVFVGRDPQRSALLQLSDPEGRPRIRLVVDAEGSARLEFLDEEGEVVSSLPDGAP